MPIIAYWKLTLEDTVFSLGRNINEIRKNEDLVIAPLLGKKTLELFMFCDSKHFVLPVAWKLPCKNMPELLRPRINNDRYNNDNNNT